MAIDFTAFTPLSALAGGALIGLSATLLILFNGRIAGISGIIGGLLRPQLRAEAGDVGWRVAFIAGLLAAPLVLFTWQLITTPERPLLRDDALHGQIGPCTFSLAEQDKHAPEIVALGVPLKTFVIRFCDACQRDIRQASLKIRQPHNTSVAGNAFAGRGTDKRVEIPVPRAASHGGLLSVSGLTRS